MAKSDEALRLLTPKQRRVYEYLKQGHKPPQIAKSMKVTRSSVYNHVRNIRRLGVTLPGEQMPGEKPESTNGAVTDAVEQAVKDAIASTETTLASIEEQERNYREQIDRLAANRAELTAKRGRYEKALEQLSA